jgi:membrane protein DedA with SNARE-associated domain/rhodanese-related sulfurtransferase
MPIHVLTISGYFLLFAWVAAEQGGLPLPAVPVLVAAGALSAGHSSGFWLALLAGLCGALVADTALFVVGRRYGHGVMHLICRLSLEPASCVRRAQDFITSHPIAALTIAKFVPGLATLASPMAGQSKLRLRQFLIFDGIGSTLWVGTFVAAGFLGRDLLTRDPSLLHWAGRFSGVLLVSGIFALLIWRVIRHRLSLRQLAAARMEPEEVKRLLDAGNEVTIVDLRHPLEVFVEPFVIPGAIRLSPAALAEGHHVIPRDRDIILYCTCPSEATSAKTALSLRKLGIERVRPLRGGYDEWKRLGFPLEEVRPAALSEL